MTIPITDMDLYVLTSRLEAGEETRIAATTVREIIAKLHEERVEHCRLQMRAERLESMVNISPLPYAVAWQLVEAGYDSMKRIRGATDAALLQVPGVGKHWLAVLRAMDRRTRG